MPKLSITSKPVQDAVGDIIVIPVDTTLDIASEILVLAKKVQFAGQWGRAEIFVSPKGFSTPFVAVVGMGSPEVSDAKRNEGIRRGVASIILDGRAHMLRNISIAIPRIDILDAVVESVLLTDYWFTQHSVLMKQEQKSRSLESVTLHVASKQDIAVAKRIVQRTEKAMAAVTLTRNLVNQPASHMSPRVLVTEAKKIEKKSPSISLTTMNRKQAEKKNLSAFLAVARGSTEEPYAIHLKYTPKKKAKKKIVLVGKAITFDSGGLSLKPANSMENMKIDMAGAATVLGLFSLLPELDLDIEVHGIILACENMPSGDAYRPGDVIPTMSGKTIEVLNTDAEGRVVLADALTYGLTLKPDAMIDLATLTGAMVVALGDTYAGLFGNNKELNAALMQSAEIAGEGLVEFPLPEEYRPTIQSRVGDVRNTSMMKMGGAITAALFLQEFVGPSTGSGQAVAWAHIDIAGPVYAEQPLIPYWQFGATGYGVRTLVRFVEGYGK